MLPVTDSRHSEVKFAAQFPNGLTFHLIAHILFVVRVAWPRKSGQLKTEIHLLRAQISEIDLVGSGILKPAGIISACSAGYIS